MAPEQEPKAAKPPEAEPFEVPPNAPVATDQQQTGTMLFVSDETAARRYMDAIKTFRKMIPAATKESDWIFYGDISEPEKCQTHLQEYAASQISRLLQTKFGYTIKIVAPTHITYPGNPVPFGIEKTIDGVTHLEIVVQGGAEIIDNITGRKETITPIYGSTTTADPFFSKRHGELLDPRSVGLGDLLKKAVANYKGNCYREIWGLKGFTLKDLADCGLDIAKVHDGKRAGPGAGASPEEKDARQQLWQRILRAHDDKADLARKWLKTMTSYPAGTNRKGEPYKANEGYEDINRLYLKNRDGSENKTYRKILNGLENLEKERGDAAEETQPAAEGTQVQGAGGHGKKKLDYIARLGACKSKEQVLALSTEIEKDAVLSKAEIEDLRGRVSRRVDGFEAGQAGSGGGQR